MNRVNSIVMPISFTHKHELNETFFHRKIQSFWFRWFIFLSIKRFWLVERPATNAEYHFTILPSQFVPADNFRFKKQHTHHYDIIVHSWRQINFEFFHWNTTEITCRLPSRQPTTMESEDEFILWLKRKSHTEFSLDSVCHLVKLKCKVFGFIKNYIDIKYGPAHNERPYMQCQWHFTMHAH